MERRKYVTIDYMFTTEIDGWNMYNNVTSIGFEHSVCQLQVLRVAARSWAEGLFDRTLLYGYELSSSFPP